MPAQRLLTLAVIALVALLLTWGLATNRWRRGRPAVIAIALVAALLLLTRRVSLVELLLVLCLPLALLFVTGRRGRAPPPRPGRRR